MRLEFNNCPNRFRFRGSINELPYCNGGFAEYYYLFPGHFVFKVPDELPEEATTSVNCALSQVIYGLQQGGMKIGDSVVIQGAGGLGINAAAAASEMGAANIIVIDGIENRLELARKCGATHTININEITDKNERIEHVKKITNQRGADVGLEVVGYPGVVAEGISMLRNGGSYVEIGNIWETCQEVISVTPGAEIGSKTGRLNLFRAISRMERTGYNFVRFADHWHHALNNEWISIEN